MFSSNRRPRLRPVPHIVRLYQIERRHVRQQMWLSPRLLRIEASWATRYIVQLLLLCWLAWAPSLLFWAALVKDGLDLDAPIGFVPHACLPMYAAAGVAVSLAYAWWRPYISYIELQVRHHMDDWYRAMCEAERRGHLY